MSEQKIFAVVGNPIEHSLSPMIHNAFAKQVGIKLSYERILASIDDFSSIVNNFLREGGTGLNVTLPFKEKAYLLVKKITERAKLAKAVNTIYLDKEGYLCGDNTDGVGLRRDLEKNLNIVLAHKEILLLGSGGAARGIVGELLKANPRRLIIANRTASRAEELVAAFDRTLAENVDLRGGGLELGVEREYDIVINASSRGFSGDEPVNFNVIAGGVVYDLSYGLHSEPLLRVGRNKGAIAIDGLGMLVEQAAEAFFCWHGIFPNTSALLTVLRSEKAENQL